MNIDATFSYRPPFGTQPARYQAIWDWAKQGAHLIEASTPVSREQSMALSDLQRCASMAIAAIAINETNTGARDIQDSRGGHR